MVLIQRIIDETNEFVAAARKNNRRIRLARQIAALSTQLETIGRKPPRNQRERWFRLYNKIRALKAEAAQLELPL